MYRILRPLLFTLPPEVAHTLSLRLLDLAPRGIFPPVPPRPVEAMGLHFAHPVGLAAGFDKNGHHLTGLGKLGFSFIEIGTVTPTGQPGNPKPRLFRLPKARALINRMGFNNAGVDALIAHRQQQHFSGILGINIGKNKTTPIHCAHRDYQTALEKVYPYADYITLNISSPNTPDLRGMQQADQIRTLLEAVSTTASRMRDIYARNVPLLVKISPDESADTQARLVDTAITFGIAGLIVSNTTIDKTAVAHLSHGQESGGLSGAPLFERSLACLAAIRNQAGQALTLIASGGIDSPAAAEAKLQAGAQLVQLYTGLVYEGPALIRRIVTQLPETC